MPPCTYGIALDIQKETIHASITPQAAIRSVNYTLFQTLLPEGERFAQSSFQGTTGLTEGVIASLKTDKYTLAGRKAVDGLTGSLHRLHDLPATHHRDWSHANQTLFSRIQSDLSPWEDGISLDMVERTYCTVSQILREGCHFQTAIRQVADLKRSQFPMLNLTCLRCGKLKILQAQLLL